MKNNKVLDIMRTDEAFNLMRKAGEALKEENKETNRTKYLHLYTLPSDPTGDEVVRMEFTLSTMDKELTEEEQQSFKNRKTNDNP